MNLTRIASLSIAALGFVLACGIAAAQQATKIPRLGLLINGGPGPLYDGIRNNLVNDFAKLGYVEGQNIVIEPRFAKGQLQKLPELAAELATLDVDIIAALGGPAAHAAQQASKTIPVIFAIVTDPVAIGLAASYERPGANVTGITSLDPQQAAKQFELLKEVFPKLQRVAILSDQTIPGADERGWAPIDRANDAAARALGLQPQILKIKGPADLDGAFAAMQKERAEALVVLEVPVPWTHRKKVAEMAASHRVPTMFPGGQADANGIITYGTAVSDTWRLIPGYADKILKGAKPGDMPVGVITRRELVVNLKTAQDMGVTIPSEILKRADRVVQ